MHEALMTLGVITQEEAQAYGEWQPWLRALAAKGRAGTLTPVEGQPLWFARERLVSVQAAYPGACLAPALVPLPGFEQARDADSARLELVRGRLGGCGPLRASAIAGALQLPLAAVEQALARLEAEGYVMRGLFQQGLDAEQWCERHLLARIHRYTVKRLRREIEPVSLQDFMRFLFDWQHLSRATRMEGSAALAQVLAQFEGYSAPVSAWESDLLPARVKLYSPTWLDDACRSGKTLWLRRASAGKHAGNTLRATPVMLLPRARLGLWQALANEEGETTISPRAQKVFDALHQQGALFFDELQSEARLLRTELENALAELVAGGLVNADSFAGLRALVAPASSRQQRSSRRGLGAFIGGMQDAGRWALLRRPNGSPSREELLEQVVMTLLRRYGVVFWRLLEREADWLPSWRELLRPLHRLEARGDIRGGRFIDGLAGEQFALPEAIPLLRELRRRPLDGSLIAVSAVDPLNLIGTLLPGARLPALAGNRLVYQDGMPVAALIAGKPDYWVEQTPALREALTHKPVF
jgi:ATP-dependent Lhr-like helicase